MVCPATTATFFLDLGKSRVLAKRMNTPSKQAKAKTETANRLARMVSASHVCLGQVDDLCAQGYRACNDVSSQVRWRTRRQWLDCDATATSSLALVPVGLS